MSNPPLPNPEDDSRFKHEEADYKVVDAHEAGKEMLEEQTVRLVTFRPNFHQGLNLSELLTMLELMCLGLRFEIHLRDDKASQRIIKRMREIPEFMEIKADDKN